VDSATIFYLGIPDCLVVPFFSKATPEWAGQWESERDTDLGGERTQADVNGYPMKTDSRLGLRSERRTFRIGTVTGPLGGRGDAFLQGGGDPSMFKGDRRSGMSSSASPLGMPLRAAAAVAVVTALAAGSRADDRGPIRRAAPEDSSGPTAPRAVVRVVGVAAPALRITLDGSGSTGRPLWYRWVQTQGPPAPLDTDGGPLATLTVPAEAGSLSYLLLVGNGVGADVASVTVPVEGKGPSARSVELRADAGDDQIGQVGRQVTLTGIRSLPRGRLGYRWVQIGGPKVSLKIEDGHIFTFVPPAVGLYQFALVVASGSEISEPDDVNVAVGVPLPPPVEEPRPAAAPVVVSLKDIARSALSEVEGGPSAGEDLGEAFREVAARMDLYGSYDELMVELTRRLEEFVPADDRRRSAWLGQVFAPLTARVIERMRAEGLDLSQPDGRAAALTRPQRRALAEQFRSIAEGFHTAGAAR
jgi:hypothetical protein